MSEGIEFRSEHKHHTSKLFIYAQTFFQIAVLQQVNKLWNQFITKKYN